MRLLLWLIILLTIVALVVDFPKTPVKFSLGSLKIDTVLIHPTLNLAKIGLPVKRDLEPKLGLDLQGGTQLTLQADMSAVAESDRQTALDSIKTVIERRVNLFGVSEPVIQTARTGNDWRVIIELPGVTDVGQAIQLIGRTAKLDFREQSATTSAQLATNSASPSSMLEQWGQTGLTGKDLKIARPSFSSQTGKPQVELEFTADGGRKFAEITSRNIQKPLAIFLDDEIISAPTVQDVISGGKAVISGDFTVEQTRNLAIQLNAGALPAPVSVVQQASIGPTLGAVSIQKSLVAGAIGLAIVVSFMIFSYGWWGGLASLALGIYSLLVFALFKTIPITLTLAGIAGFILSIGMAVDANILIF